jgi:hypothetical protein
MLIMSRLTGTSVRATVEMDSCVIGGSGSSDDRLARIGITVGDDCKVTLNKSTVTWCKQFGVTISDNALISMAACSILDNKIGLSIEGDCRVFVNLTAFKNSAASFKIDDRHRYSAKLSAIKCRFDDSVWFGGVMPVRDPDDPPDVLGTDEYSEPNCLQHHEACTREYVDASYHSSEGGGLSRSDGGGGDDGNIQAHTSSA